MSSHVLSGRESERMADALSSALREADEACFASAFVAMTGVQLLLPALSSFLARGRLRVLTSTYLDFTEPQALRSLLALPNTTVRVQDGPRGFHAKAYLLTSNSSSGGGGGRSRVFVGSSNWTRGGLADNLEWNLSRDDDAALLDARALFDELWHRGDVRAIDEGFLEAYALRWRRRRLATSAPRAAPEAVPLALADEGPGYAPALAPNEAQREALAGLDALRRGNARRALVIAATGVGKTLLAAFAAQRFGARTVLFLAHRKALLEQAAREFARVHGASVRCAVLIEGRPWSGEPYVFASVQSYRALPAAHPLRARTHELVVVDEFHHAEAASWRALLASLDATFLLGVTATPERGDGRDILELCDWNVAYELRLPAALSRGLLKPFHYFGVHDEHVDYGRLAWHPGRGFDERELELALLREDRVEQLLAHAREKGFDGPKRVALGFCAGRTHASFMAAALEKRGVRAAVVLGDTPLEQRDAVYARLQDPHDALEWLFVADVLNEGADLPALNVLAFLRPTQSVALFLQQLGRGLRLYPQTAVLTVLDFVGHHRLASLPLRALHDGAAPPRIGAALLGFTPPERCEFLLEDRTVEMLRKLREGARTARERAEGAYLQLREELGRPPRPVDFWERADVPTFWELRDRMGSWTAARVKLGDAQDWERALTREQPLAALLALAEQRGQAQRVTGLALLWAALDTTVDVLHGYGDFFAAHPHWGVEAAALTPAEAHARLEGELGAGLWRGGAWVPAVAAALRDERVREGVRERLLPTLAADFKQRHCGALRTPGELRLFGAYGRPELVNYFGQQYDPAKHNTGVLSFEGGHTVLLAKLNTRGARKEFQYDNGFVDRAHFLWTSQNRQRRDNEAGRKITEHEARGTAVHLFVYIEPRLPARYLGRVRFESAEGDAPMRVRFALEQPAPAWWCGDDPRDAQE